VVIGERRAHERGDFSLVVKKGARKKKGEYHGRWERGGILWKSYVGENATINPRKGKKPKSLPKVGENKERKGDWMSTRK